MRLTLRTLLAWRDGLLESPEREELAAKIGERGLARSLLERIEAVSTRSELGVPKLEGRGLAADANSVAAYLENTLEPEKLEPFERICLESDVHLAEVAECHAVLAEMTAKPPRDVSSRKTLLSLVKRKLAEAAEDGGGERAVGRQPGTKPGPRTPDAPRSRRPQVVVVAEDDEPSAVPLRGTRRRASQLSDRRASQSPDRRASQSPDRRASQSPDKRASQSLGRRASQSPGRRASQSPDKRASPWLQLTLAVALLVVSGAGLALVLWRTAGVESPLPDRSADAPPEADRRRESGDAEPAAATPSPAQAEDLASADNAAEPTVEAAAPVASPDSGQLSGRGPQPPSPPAAPEPQLTADQGLPTPSGPRVPMGDAMAIATTVAPGPEALLPPAMAPEPPRIPADGGGVVADDAAATDPWLVARGPVLLLADDAVEGDWRGCLPGESLPAESRLLVPPECFPEIEIDGLVVGLGPQSQVVIRPQGERGAARAQFGDARGQPAPGVSGQPSGVELEVVFGRAVIRQQSANAGCVIAAGQLRWGVRLAAGEAVAVEVALLREPGTDPLTEAAELRATIVPLKGDLAWVAAGADPGPGLPAEGLVPRGSAARWSSQVPAELRVGPSASPDWVNRTASPDRLASSAADAFAARIRDGGSVLAAARAMAADSRIESREVAAGTLALTGEYAEAVAVLCDEAVGRRPGERRWRQFEASVVPLALARGMHSAERLKQALQEALPAGVGEQMFRLAVGFSEAQLTAGEDARLVAALADDRLGIRRYAALRLTDLVQPGPRDAARYQADAAEETRAEAVRWWGAQLEKGLIRPPETGQLSGREDG